MRILAVIFGLLSSIVLAEPMLAAPPDGDERDVNGLWRFGGTTLCLTGTAGSGFSGRIVALNPDNRRFKNGDVVLKIYAADSSIGSWGEKDPPIREFADGEILSKAEPTKNPGLQEWGGFDIFQYDGRRMVGRAAIYYWKGEDIVEEKYVPVTFTRLPRADELEEELSKLEQTMEFQRALFELEDRFVQNLEALYGSLKYGQYSRADRGKLRRLARDYEKQVAGKKIRELLIDAAWERIDKEVSREDLSSEMHSVSLEVAKELEGKIVDDILKPLAKEAHSLLAESDVSLEEFTAKFREEAGKTTLAIAKGVYLRELKQKLKKSGRPEDAESIEAIENLWRGLKRAKKGDVIEAMENVANIGKVYMDALFFATLDVLNFYNPHNKRVFEFRVRDRYLDLHGRPAMIDKMKDGRRELNRLLRSSGKKRPKLPNPPLLLLNIKNPNSEIDVKLDVHELLVRYHEQGPSWTERLLEGRRRSLNRLENQVAEVREELEKSRQHSARCGTGPR